MTYLCTVGQVTGFDGDVRSNAQLYQGCEIGFF